MDKCASCQSDMFKRYPLRFGGYGFGMAEALSGHVTHPVFNGLRAMATGFIFAHTIFRPVQVSKRTNSSLKVVTSAADTFLYEAVASGFIPPSLAVGMRRLAAQIPCPPSCAASARAWIPPAVALVSLPIMIPPCDRIVDLLMDATVRQLY